MNSKADGKMEKRESAEKNLLSIGLTGTIGSGKSTVASLIAQAGYRVIDADRISHQLTEKGSPFLPQLAKTFGSDMVKSDGSLDRKKLADLIFSDPRQNQKIRQLLTKEVVRRMAVLKAELEREGKEKLLFFDIPLLFESHCEFLCDKIWVVTAPDHVLIERASRRDGQKKKEIIRRMKSQMPAEEKEKRADECIDNSGSLSDLEEKVRKLLTDYVALQRGN